MNTHTATVNISFPRALLKAMDVLAEQEARSRSEVLRDAARMYIERKERWQSLFAFGKRHAKTHKIKPEELELSINEYRARHKT